MVEHYLLVEYSHTYDAVVLFFRDILHKTARLRRKVLECWQQCHSKAQKPRNNLMLNRSMNG